MAIADRIEEMYTHVGEVYDTITNVTLPEHKNIENIPRTIRDSYLEIINNGINVIYDNWEKVTGEGTSLTLTPTEEAPMKIVYKGNTYQYSTSGKNMFSGMASLGNGSTYTNGVLTIPNATYNKSNNLNVESSTAYYINFESTKTNTRTYIREYDSNDTQINIITKYSPSTFTTSATTTYIVVDFSPSSSDIPVSISKIMVSKGSTQQDYEEYSGNQPSPNPDYPQDIHVVSGDNTIEVVGKNLIDIEEYLSYASSYTKNSDGSYTFATTTSLYNEGMPVNISQEFTISYSLLNVTGTNFGIRCGFADGYQLDVPRSGSSTTEYYNATYTVTQSTLDNHGKVTSLRGNWSVAGTFTIKDLMIEYGAKTSYVPYTGASYPINLNGNILDKTKLIDGWVRGSNGNYENTYTSTYSCTDFLEVKPNTTYSIDLYDYTGLNSGGVVEYNSGKTYIQSTNETQRVITFTTTENTKYIRFTIRKDSISEVVYTIGSSIPTPIELCKIGTYQDKIDKSTGKNILQYDNENNPSRSLYTYTTERPERITCTKNTTGNDFYAQYIAYLEEGKTYTLSVDDDTNRNIYMYSDRLWGTAISGLTNKNAKYGTPFTFTSPYTGIAYIGFFGGGTQTLTMPMLNEGTTTLPYEPYGTSWYLKKEIGKVILNGTEDWSAYQNTIYNNTILSDTGKGALISGRIIGGYCNRDSISGNTNLRYSSDDRTGIQFYHVTDYWGATSATASAFNTYLSSNNVIIYYPLATPTYTLIEGELLNQLEAIKMSYEGQTNLSQTNNDLASVLNASALKKV